MIVPDVSLLLLAEIDATPHHARARHWWTEVLNGTGQVGLPGVSLFGFIRIGTNRRVFEEPLPMREAVSRVQAWLERPNVSLLVPGPRHLEIAFRLLCESGAAGEFTTDVQVAAHAIELGGQVHSTDTDFGRFGGLSWINPLAG